MKTLKKWLKTIALFLTALILFQSCSVYKTPVTLEQAVLEQKEVKITTASDESVKYKYIVYEDGQFYGVKNNPGEDVKFSYIIFSYLFLSYSIAIAVRTHKTIIIDF